MGPGDAVKSKLVMQGCAANNPEYRTAQAVMERNAFRVIQVVEGRYKIGDRFKLGKVGWGGAWRFPGLQLHGWRPRLTKGEYRVTRGE